MSNSNNIQTLEFYQGMLEHLDSKEKACNLIVMGLNEEIPLDGDVTDENKY